MFVDDVLVLLFCEVVLFAGTGRGGGDGGGGDGGGGDVDSFGDVVCHVVCAHDIAQQFSKSRSLVITGKDRRLTLRRALIMGLKSFPPSFSLVSLLMSLGGHIPNELRQTTNAAQPLKYSQASTTKPTTTDVLAYWLMANEDTKYE